MPRTKIIKITLYKFHELNGASKERAKMDFKEGHNFGHEELASIKALAKHFSGYIADYSISWDAGNYSSMTFSMPGLSRPEIRRRLAKLGKFCRQTKKGYGDCKLTGYCTDENAIDGLRLAFLAGESDLDKLMQAAFRSWLEAGQDDYAAQYEDENFAEMCEASGYEFKGNGELA